MDETVDPQSVLVAKSDNAILNVTEIENTEKSDSLVNEINSGDHIEDNLNAQVVPMKKIIQKVAP